MPSATASLPDVLTLEELALRYGPVELQKPLSKEEFAALTERYPDLQMERDADGAVTVMSPVKKGSGRRESRLFLLLGLWWHQTGSGELFGSSAGFDLPVQPLPQPFPQRGGEFALTSPSMQKKK